eukprot:GHRR01004562.1.p1 GENE.GHRR01004562.1~~GHRR01004562.1.p1  ORF type:complete len:198 (+),score=42.86 GHRR01004562.1:137-730(+)
MLCRSPSAAFKGQRAPATCNTRPVCFVGCVGRSHGVRGSLVRAAPETVDLEQIGDLIAAEPLSDEQKGSLERLTNTLGLPLGTAKQMVFKKRALLKLEPSEILERVRQVADVVGVTTDQAIEMVTIQPGLLFDTQRNAEALSLGIRAICYELNAPKEEIVELILKNQSVLHGREMHLSVADIAHLAMLREPTGRIAE